jgi:hypothetical protein
LLYLMRSPFIFEPLCLRAYRYVPATVHAVEFEQAGGGLGTAFQLDDMDNPDLGIVECGPQRQATHASRSRTYLFPPAWTWPLLPRVTHHAARSNLPISVTQRSRAKRSRVSIGRAVKILMRRSNSV